MPTPQPGIFALGTRSHHHLELDLLGGAEPGDVVDALAAIAETTGGAANLVLGFGPDLWARLAPGAVPDGLGPFTEIVGREGHRAPATQHDIWAWVHGSAPDDVLDTALGVAARLGTVASLAQETECFVYHDSRDLTGFIDGTANPTPVEAPEVALVPEGQPGAGGSHVIAQRWVHDLESFNRLEVSEQEKVFGRTKPDSEELPEGVKPPDAHISLTEIHDERGEELPIFRRSTPFGGVAEKGLFFLGFSSDRSRFEKMLSAMFGVGEGQLRDRLLDFSTPVSGSFYFAPSLDDLEAL